jgi:hypothetical protein
MLTVTFIEEPEDAPEHISATCPHCGTVTAFSGFSSVDLLIGVRRSVEVEQSP